MADAVVAQSSRCVRNIAVVTVAWTGDADGAVPDTTLAEIDGGLSGYKLLLMDTIPDGDVAPTNAYDITLEDEDGFDILGGAGANRSSSAQERAVPLVGTTPVEVPVSSALTLKIAANSVDAGGGVIKFYFERAA